jgi:hypothetical protein
MAKAPPSKGKGKGNPFSNNIFGKVKPQSPVTDKTKTPSFPPFGKTKPPSTRKGKK